MKTIKAGYGGPPLFMNLPSVTCSTGYLLYFRGFYLPSSGTGLPEQAVGFIAV